MNQIYNTSTFINSIFMHRSTIKGRLVYMLKDFGGFYIVNATSINDYRPTNGVTIVED